MFCSVAYYEFFWLTGICLDNLQGTFDTLFRGGARMVFWFVAIGGTLAFLSHQLDKKSDDAK